METFRDYNGKFCGNGQRQTSNISVLVALHAGGWCAPAVHQSSERWHLEFAFCIRLDKCAHIDIDMSMPTMPGGESYILQT